MFNLKFKPESGDHLVILRHGHLLDMVGELGQRDGRGGGRPESLECSLEASKFKLNVQEIFFIKRFLA